MKKILELSGIIFACALVPYLIASLLEWGFVVDKWNDPTRIILGLIYFALVPIAVFAYLTERK